MPAPVSLCPKCGAAFPPERQFCPLCGSLRPRETAWPPPIAGFLTSPMPAAQTLTGSAGVDVAAGVGMSLAPWPAMIGLGYAFGTSLYESALLLVPPVLYFVLRRRYPFVARGVGVGLLVNLVLVPVLLVVGAVLLALGVLSLCRQNFPS